MNALSVANRIFVGENKYTIGFIFVFGNLAGFFFNMRKLDIPDSTSIVVLAAMAAAARCVA